MFATHHMRMPGGSLAVGTGDVPGPTCLQTRVYDKLTFPYLDSM